MIHAWNVGKGARVPGRSNLSYYFAITGPENLPPGNVSLMVVLMGDFVVSGCDCARQRFYRSLHE
jgi:hypothetical protein